MFVREVKPMGQPSKPRRRNWIFKRKRITLQKKKRKRPKKPTYNQRGGQWDSHTFLTSLSKGKPLHWPRYNYLGPGTKDFSKKPLNRLDQAARQHDLNYHRAKHFKDKWKADLELEQTILKFPGRKNVLEHSVARLMRIKRKLKL